MAYDGGSDPTLAELITRKFIPEMFSSEVLRHTQSHLVVANAFTHRFKNNLRKGYKVAIPVMSEIGTTDVTPGTEPTAKDAAGVAVEIEIDQWKETTVEISPLIAIEEEAEYLQNAARGAAYSIDKVIDTFIGAKLSALASGSVEGAVGQKFTDVIFRALVQTLDEKDVPDEGRFLIGDPSTKSDLLDIDKFVRSDFIGGSPTTNGKFGTLYNAQVVITNNLASASPGHYGVYAHPDAIGVVIQKNPNANVYNMGYKFITKIIVDAAYGAGELRAVFGKSFYTRQA